MVNLVVTRRLIPGVGNPDSPARRHPRARHRDQSRHGAGIDPSARHWEDEIERCRVSTFRAIGITSWRSALWNAEAGQMVNFKRDRNISGRGQLSGSGITFLHGSAELMARFHGPRVTCFYVRHLRGQIEVLQIISDPL
jgi:hypothetical protein